MLCSGCGKDVPFGGSVCPYCQRDKSKDQARSVMSFIFSIVGAVIGYWIFGFWGVIGGFVIGCFTGLFVFDGGDAKPPEVRVAPQTELPQIDQSVEAKLIQLKKLHDQGLLTLEEFANKKAEILARL